MYDEYKELSEQERIVKFSFYSPPTAGYADGNKAKEKIIFFFQALL
jgi:hypothetical protein